MRQRARMDNGAHPCCCHACWGGSDVMHRCCRNECRCRLPTRTAPLCYKLLPGYGLQWVGATLNAPDATGSMQPAAAEQGDHMGNSGGGFVGRGTEAVEH